MSPSHGYCANAAEDDDDQDTDGDGEDSHHGHGVLDGQSDCQPQDTASIVNHQQVGSLVRSLHSNNAQCGGVAVLLVTWLRLGGSKPASLLPLLQTEAAPSPDQLPGRRIEIGRAHV